MPPIKSTRNSSGSSRDGRREPLHKWGIRDRDPLPCWTSGRITLLGRRRPSDDADAGAEGGDGAGDAFAISRQLARYRDDSAGGLKAYEAERLPRTGKVMLQAREQFWSNRKVPAPRPLSRDWIFARDVTIGAPAAVL